MYAHKITVTAVIAIALASGANAAKAGVVDVSFVVAGSPGAWVVDFTFSNNLSTASGLYLIGIKSDGFLSGAPLPFVQAFGGAYNTLAAGGLDITYNVVWLDVPGTALRPGTSMSGFKVTVPTAQPPVAFDWFAMTRGAIVTDPFQFGNSTAAGYQGVVTSVPEPHAIAMFGFGLAALAVRRRLLCRSRPIGVA